MKARRPLAPLYDARLIAETLSNPSLAANVIAAPNGDIRFFDPMNQDSLLKAPLIKPKAAPFLSEQEATELKEFKL